LNAEDELFRTDSIGIKKMLQNSRIEIEEKELTTLSGEFLNHYGEMRWRLELENSDFKDLIIGTGYDSKVACRIRRFFSKAVTKDAEEKLTITEGILKVLVEKSEDALMIIKSYPKGGLTYHTILYHRYFSKEYLSHEGIMETIGMKSRSTYFRKLDEAILFFGILMYDYLI